MVSKKTLKEVAKSAFSPEFVAETEKEYLKDKIKGLQFQIEAQKSELKKTKSELALFKKNARTLAIKVIDDDGCDCPSCKLADRIINSTKDVP